MKYCPKCGQSANDNDQYCPKCGSPLSFDVETNQEVVQPKQSNVWAILGLVFSILIWPLGLIFSLAGIFFGRIRNGKYLKIAYIGLIISILDFVAYTILVFLKIFGVFDYWYFIFGD